MSKNNIKKSNNLMDRDARKRAPVMKRLCVKDKELWVDYIKPKGDPVELAEKAYRDGYYVEAIQILHAYLENQARSLFMLVGCVHFNAKQLETWDVADSFTFHDCIKALFVLNQITPHEFEEFAKFNSLRNKVIHQLYKEPYEKVHPGIPKVQYDEVFNRTLEQADFFLRKNEEIVC